MDDNRTIKIVAGLLVLGVVVLSYLWWTTKSNLDKHFLKVKELEATIEAKVIKIGELEVDIASKEEELKKVQELNKNIQSNLDVANNKVNELMSEIKQLKEDRDVKVKEVDELTSSKNQLEMSLSNLQKAHDELMEKANDDIKNYNKARELVDELTKKLEEKSEQASECLDKNTSLMAKIVSLQTKLGVSNQMLSNSCDVDEINLAKQFFELKSQYAGLYNMKPLKIELYKTNGTNEKSCDVLFKYIPIGSQAVLGKAGYDYRRFNYNIQDGTWTVNSVENPESGTSFKDLYRCGPLEMKLAQKFYNDNSEHKGKLIMTPKAAVLVGQYNTAGLKTCDILYDYHPLPGTNASPGTANRRFWLDMRDNNKWEIVKMGPRGSGTGSFQNNE